MINLWEWAVLVNAFGCVIIDVDEFEYIMLHVGEFQNLHRNLKNGKGYNLSEHSSNWSKFPRLIGWFISVLRHIGNISAIQQPCMGKEFKRQLSMKIRSTAVSVIHVYNPSDE